MKFLRRAQISRRLCAKARRHHGCFINPDSAVSVTAR